MEGAVPINTFIRHFSPTSIRDGLHVMETFAGVTCGVPQSALAASYKARMYTYVDKDPISQKMAASCLSDSPDRRTVKGV